MARELPAVGTVSYNGYTFPPAFSMNVRCKSIYDTADRARKYIQHVLTIDTIVLPIDAPHATTGSQTDVNMTDIKKRLQTPGKALTITDQGFGPVTVDGTTVVDSRFGPKPQVLEWSSVGSNRACRVLWQCEFYLPVCSDSTPLYKNAFAEFTYEVSYAINQGMTTRVMRCTIEVPIAKAGNGIADTADAYRDYFNPPVPVGFHRERLVQISRDKRTIDITLIDTEIDSDNPYPEGAVEIEADHSIESSFDEDAFIVYHSSLSCRIKVAANVPKIQGWQMFRAIASDRFAKGSGPIQIKGLRANEFAAQSFPLRTYFRASESIFSREIEFELEWEYLANLTDAFARSGLFTPVPNTNWNQWKTSMAAINGTRGIAGMRHLNTDDIIVDLCAFNYPTPNSDVQKPYYNGADSPFADECPPPEYSYRKFKPVFEFSYETNIAQHAKSAQASISSIVKATATEGTPSTVGFNPRDMSDSNYISSQDEHTIQIRGPSIPQLVFYGMAQRYCHQIPVPQVAEWGGATPYQVFQKAKHFVIKTSGTRILNGLVWYQVYKMNKIPDGDISNIKTSGTPESYGADRT